MKSAVYTDSRTGPPRVRQLSARLSDYARRALVSRTTAMTSVHPRAADAYALFHADVRRTLLSRAFAGHSLVQ